MSDNDKKAKGQELPEGVSGIFTPKPGANIRDKPPEVISRPLCIVAGHAYSITWVWTDDRDQDVSQLVIIRDDGVLFSDGPIAGALILSDLAIKVKLADAPDADRLWSGAALKKYLNGYRADPADLFKRMSEVIDNFMDFDRGIIPDQKLMCNFLACFALSTFFTESFYVVGNIFANAEKGSGKTHLLEIMALLSYLGKTILMGTSFASMRDLSAHGGMLGFDDCERFMDKRGDPDKQSLILAGNRKGTSIDYKEPAPSGKGGWVRRSVSAYGPKMFSAISKPLPTLASRSITFPLVRSMDKKKSDRNPLNTRSWPHDRKQILDDSWNCALANLKVLSHYDEEAANRSELQGRDLEPWRPTLAVALWLQTECGIKGLFDDTVRLSVAYQKERIELEIDDMPRLLFKVLVNAFQDYAEVHTLPIKEIRNNMNEIAQDEGLRVEGELFTTPRAVGGLLGRLRLGEPVHKRNQRLRRITRKQLQDECKKYQIEWPEGEGDVVPF